MTSTAADPAPQESEPPNPEPPASAPAARPVTARWAAGARRVSPRTVVLLAVAAATALRVAILLTPAVQIDGDQAVTGIMVRRMLNGDAAYVYFAGQRYNGAIEQYVQVLMYWLTPLPQNSFTLRLPEVAYSALATWLVFVVGRRLLGHDWRAAVAAVIFAVAPYWSVWKSTHSDGAYPSVLLLGVLAIWAALRWQDDERARWPLLLGLLLGLIVWNGLTGYELAVPALLIAGRRLRSWPGLIRVLAAAVVGAGPMLVFAVTHHVFPPLDTGLWVNDSTLGGRAGYFFGPVLREFVGVAGLSGRPGWPLLAQYVIAVLVWGALLLALIRRRRGLLDALLLRGGDPLDALLAALPIVAAVFVASPESWDFSNPHYLYVLTPVLVWLLAAIDPPGLPALGRRVGAAALVAVMAATSLTMIVNRAGVYPPTTDSDLRAAAAYLRANDEHFVFASYWTSMPLQYLAPDIVASPIEGGQGKFPDHNRRVYDSGQVVYVQSTRNISGAPARHVPILEALRARHIQFRTHVFGGVTVYDQLVPALPPWLLGLGRRGPERPDPEV